MKYFSYVVKDDKKQRRDDFEKIYIFAGGIRRFVVCDGLFVEQRRDV